MVEKLKEAGKKTAIKEKGNGVPANEKVQESKIGRRNEGKKCGSICHINKKTKKKKKPTSTRKTNKKPEM